MLTAKSNIGKVASAELQKLLSVMNTFIKIF